MSQSDYHESCHPGRNFCVSLSGSALTTDESRMLQHVRPGCVLLFARNCQTPRQVRNLTDELRRLLGQDVLIAIDQEGGRVDRLRALMTPMPAVAEVISGGKAAAARLGTLTAQILRVLGINFNFAPVLDVADEPECDNSLATRTWGNDPQTTGVAATEYLRSLQAEGIIGCPKHFPGLGGAESDPHHELPVIRKNVAELLAADLLPFRHAIASGLVHSVMISHAAYPALAPDETDLIPASLSPHIITDLLRRRLQFDGVAVTDDLSMGAVSQMTGSVTEAVRAAGAAGADMLLVCGATDQVLAAYENLRAHSNRETDWRIRQSGARIARLRDGLRSPVAFDLTLLQSLSDSMAEFRQELGLAPEQRILLRA